MPEKNRVVEATLFHPTLLFVQVQAKLCWSFWCLSGTKHLLEADGLQTDSCCMHHWEDWEDWRSELKLETGDVLDASQRKPDASGI